jgi:hypothetical protein
VKANGLVKLCLFQSVKIITAAQSVKNYNELTRKISFGFLFLVGKCIVGDVLGLAEDIQTLTL